MSLEDEFTDVIAKAMRGLGIDVPGLSEASGIAVGEIETLLGGQMKEFTARAISPAPASGRRNARSCSCPPATNGP
jgi:hypothetical protein